jgi:hypothetical protein
MRLPHKTFGRSGHIKVAAFVHAVCIALRTVAVELLLPLHHVALAAVLLDQLRYLPAALPIALSAFDAQHVELALNVAEGDVTADLG